MLSKATILMATYNGEKFLDKQLESISRQINIIPRIYALDAGSTDRTIAIFEDWIEKGLKINYRISAGSDPSKSFMVLLRERQEDRFIFFSDQDDVWDQDKCITMIDKHRETNSDVVICDRLVIDERGEVVENQGLRKISLSWNNALVENMAYGNCTMVTSRFARYVVGTAPPDKFLYDSWIYLVASLQKNISFINAKKVSYRIHSGNAIGISGNLAYIRKFKGWMYLTHQVLSLKDEHMTELSECEKKALMTYRDCFEKFSFLNLVRGSVKNPALRQSRFQSIIFKSVFPILVILFLILSKRQ
jgi:glycosyltransferase involved in cell wall biosynthesis